MGEPLSLDRMFNFPIEESEPHLAYDLLLDRYPVMLVDEPMVDPTIDEIADPIVEVEEQMVASVIDMKGDLAMLFGDDDSSDDRLDDKEDDEEVWEVNEEWLMALDKPPPMPVMPPSSTYDVGGPSTAAAEGHSLAFLAPRVPMPP
nr:hypothetical protein [Tanacetum cinerariifolium]